MAINSEDKATEEACIDILRSGVRQMRYRLKKKYFIGIPANEVRTTSLVACMTDEQWRALVAKWTDPKNMVLVSSHFYFLIQFQVNSSESIVTCSFICMNQVKRTNRIAIKSSITRLRVLAAMWHTYMPM